MPSVLLIFKSPGNTDGRHVGFKSLIEKQLAFLERAPDNGAGCGRCPTATAVGAMRENARVTVSALLRLSTTNYIEILNDDILLQYAENQM
jgi:hypothetical protein